jgi:hypothetical protein
MMSRILGSEPSSYRRSAAVTSSVGRSPTGRIHRSSLRRPTSMPAIQRPPGFREFARHRIRFVIGIGSSPCDRLRSDGPIWTTRAPILRSSVR